MSTVEQQVKKIVAEQLGVKEEEVTNDASFVERAEILREKGTTTYERMTVRVLASEDGVHWKEPWRVMTPEARDAGILEFYSASGTIDVSK